MNALPAPTLMLVTDRALAGGSDALVQQVAAAVAGGVNAVQLREKDLSDADLLDLALRLRAAIAGRAALLVNGPVELALAAEADGVHGGEDAAPVAETRRAAGDRLLVGRSVHATESAAVAAEAGADYLVLGTIFPSRSHPGGEIGGVERVAAVADRVRTPIVAIGGLSEANIGAVVEAGASGVAAISAILGQRDARAAAASLRSTLDRAWIRRSRQAHERGTRSLRPVDPPSTSGRSSAGDGDAAWLVDR